MLCGDTTYTVNQIVKILTKEKLQKGTQEFVDAMKARFYPVGDGIYAERDDWVAVSRAKAKTGERYDVC